MLYRVFGLSLFCIFYAAIIKADDDQTIWRDDPLCFPNYTLSFFPVPEDCRQYYRCYLGDKYLMDCPKGLWWHQSLKMCDTPGTYCVASTTSPDSSTSQTATPTRPSVSSTTNSQPNTDPHLDPRCVDGNTNYWPHPTQCRKYVECYKQNSYEMACPPKLYFSAQKKECVNADESECCKANINACV